MSGRGRCISMLHTLDSKELFVRFEPQVAVLVVPGAQYKTPDDSRSVGGNRREVGRLVEKLFVNVMTDREGDIIGKAVVGEVS